MSSEAEELEVDCAIHGRLPCAVVCGHMVHTDAIVGFVENSSDPGDLQAWCDACEQFFLEEEAMTEAFRAFTDMTIVCEACYARLRVQHSAGKD